MPFLGARASCPQAGRRPAIVQAGKMPALVWSAPRLQGGCDAGKQVQLHTCIRPLEWERRFPGPDGIRARLASSPRRPRMGPARAQARGMPVRPVLPSTSHSPRNCWRARSRPESSPRHRLRPCSVVARRRSVARSDVHGLSTGAGPRVPVRPAGHDANRVAPEIRRFAGSPPRRGTRLPGRRHAEARSQGTMMVEGRPAC